METIRHTDKRFTVSARLEKKSRRIWVVDYQAIDHGAMCDFLWKLASAREFDKIVFPVKNCDLKTVLKNGFRPEGIIQKYFGETDAYFLAAYPSSDRSYSISLYPEQKMLKEISSLPRGWKGQQPGGFTIRQAEVKDAPLMADLFKRVFTSYPTPVHDPVYLAQCMEKNSIFILAFKGTALAGAASAEVQWDHRRAELSDCATDPDYRGIGLNTYILSSLEKTCLAMGIECLYSLSRASSYGMNLILHRLGYEFGGTLINNCHIGGRYENMNVWVKPSREKAAV